MDILITGASGFLGRHIVKNLLKKNFKVHALILPCDSTPKIIDPNLKYFPGNVLDKYSLKKAMINCQAIIHAAGATNLKKLSPAALQNLNVLGTKQVCEVAKLLNIKKLIFVSSLGTLGGNTKPKVLTENSPADNFQTLSHYYLTSKRQSEALAFSEQSNNFKVISVLPAMLWGPEDWFLSSIRYAWWAWQKRTLYYTENTGMSILDITDAAQGVVNALLYGRAGQKYLLAGENITAKKMCQFIAQHPNIEVNLKKISAAAIKTLKLLTSGLVFLKFNLYELSDILNYTQLYWWGDSRLAKKEINFKTNYSAQEAITRSLDWLKDNYSYLNIN